VTHILNDVLSLQKMEEGSLVLELRPFDMERTVRTTFYSFKAPCLERELRIKLELQMLQQSVYTQLSSRCKHHAAWPASISPAAPQFKLVGDPQRLRQVMSHYASNAIKHSHRGGDILVKLEFTDIHLDESLIQELQENKKGLAALPHSFFQYPVGSVLMMLSVSDNGVGIPREHHSNVFKAYTEIDASSLSNHKGSGLGLSASRSLMQLMGGQVGFTSEENRGSKFFFEIDMELRLVPASTPADDELDALHMDSGMLNSCRNRRLTVFPASSIDKPGPGLPDPLLGVRSLSDMLALRAAVKQAPGQPELLLGCATPTPPPRHLNQMPHVLTQAALLPGRASSGGLSERLGAAQMDAARHSQQRPAGVILGNSCPPHSPPAAASPSKLTAELSTPPHPHRCSADASVSHAASPSLGSLCLSLPVTSDVSSLHPDTDSGSHQTISNAASTPPLAHRPLSKPQRARLSDRKAIDAMHTLHVASAAPAMATEQQNDPDSAADIAAASRLDSPMTPPVNASATPQSQAPARVRVLGERTNHRNGDTQNNASTVRSPL
jgi:hypothetical protein